MNECAEPDCTGAVDDGYCDECGMAPSARAAAVPAPRAAAGTAAAAPPSASAPSRPPAPPEAGGRAEGAAGDGRRPNTGGPAAAPAPPSGRSPSLREARLSGSSGVAGQGAYSGGDPVAGTPSHPGAPSSRGLLGLGMVEVPPVPYRDPAGAVLSNPLVAERSRVCGHCGASVGRSREGRSGRTEGYCPSCRTEFSFTPKLAPGDVVAGQYEVLGCLAHGGLGWIYLARDHNVDDRWVVLKGLLNVGDAEAHKTAAAERGVLAEVEHPNVVKIYNFVQHPDPRTGVPAGHIVMEYVGGQSLWDLRMDHLSRDPGADGLPVDRVIAYGLEALRALGHLHSKGLLYCDFKPDNVIQSEEQIKIIDLGAVRRIDDLVTPVYTTVGYRVPERELREIGPSIGSDLYSVARCLAVLSFRFDYGGAYRDDLPDAASVPVLRRHPSYDRLLRRALQPEPQLRFSDAAEMAEQLTGVLREVLSEMHGRPHPAQSNLFGAEHPLFTSGNLVRVIDETDRLLGPPDPEGVAAALPLPLVDPADEAAAELSGLAALPDEDLVAALEGDAGPTPETRLLLARALIGVGRREEAARQLQEFGACSPGDWRPFWYWAVMALGARDCCDARERFEELFDHLPGEAAPKLGLAGACELTGGLDEAEQLYRTVWLTDRSFVTAGFGLARIRLARGDPAGAVQVLDMVPELSSVYIAAQMAAVSALVTDREPASLSEAVFLDAVARLRRLGLRGEARDRLNARVLRTALDWVLAGYGPESPRARLLGAPLTEGGLRANLERSYRERARITSDPARRRVLVDRANAVRPRTLL
ncbi:serine/threonine-protein kinase [Streptomonospora wellingtoniae]|uniref:non-specific serine/threonine protein kinase n=1 Tax=Streptomonospora wellingtoniae TaxID=3075544 RepID=A0ABU2KNE6_9ACTN|nr:tetratricopeptide repeat protein [Streptomonospora sp. DSM 45055]MDT0300789.1 tetratricopeptide repeat protein [Streptomonospora sp. DSM 45055]